MSHPFVTFSFEHIDQLIMVPLYLNGLGPFNFGLDTGTSGGIDQNVCENNKFDTNQDYAFFNKISLSDDIILVQDKLPLVDLTMINSLLDNSEDGIFGKWAFDQTIVSINYPKKEVSIFPKSAGIEEVSKSFAGDDAWIKNNFEFLDDEMVRNCPLVELDLNDSIKGKFLLDTGCYAMSISEDMKNKLEMETQVMESPDEDVPDLHVGMVSSIALSDAKSENVVVAVVDEEGQKYDGILGVTFLQNFHVIIDYSTKTILLK